MWIIRAILVLILVASIAVPPAMAEEKEYDISDVYGWYAVSSWRQFEEEKLFITPDSITAIFTKSSDWYKVKGRFRKLGKSRFLLVPEEAFVSEQQDINKYGCRYIDVEIYVGAPGKKPGDRPDIFSANYESLEHFEKGDYCAAKSGYHPIEPPKTN